MVERMQPRANALCRPPVVASPVQPTDRIVNETTHLGEVRLLEGACHLVNLCLCSVQRLVGVGWVFIGNLRNAGRCGDEATQGSLRPHRVRVGLGVGTRRGGRHKSRERGVPARLVNESLPRQLVANRHDVQHIATLGDLGDGTPYRPMLRRREVVGGNLTRV